MTESYQMQRNKLSLNKIPCSLLRVSEKYLSIIILLVFHQMKKAKNPMFIAKGPFGLRVLEGRGGEGRGGEIFNLKCLVQFLEGKVRGGTGRGANLFKI